MRFRENVSDTATFIVVVGGCEFEGSVDYTIIDYDYDYCPQDIVLDNLLIYHGEPGVDADISWIFSDEAMSSIIVQVKESIMNEQEIL